MTKECSYEGCNRPIESKASGLCQSHNIQRRKGQELHPVGEWGVRHLGECVADGCTRPIDAGMSRCAMHYWRMRNKGEDGSAGSSFNGNNWYKAPGGYLGRKVRTRREDGTRKDVLILQHREVMEQHIGRPLTVDETVHHMNGVKTDNRIENLELWSSRHPKGQRVEDKLAWAREMLELYADYERIGDATPL